MGHYATKFATVNDIDREWLQGQWKTGHTHTFRCRAHAILLSTKRMSIAEISLILGVTYETINAWIDRWNQQGREGIFDGEHPGRPPILDEGDRTIVQKIVESHPQQPSVILQKVQEQTKKSISSTTLRRVLRSMGFRWKRMRFSLRNRRDSKAFKKASQHLKRLVSSGKTDVVFLDEAHFSTVGVVGYAWQMKGERLLVPISGGSRKGIQVIGFLSAGGRVQTYVQQSRVLGETIVSVIDDYVKKVKRKTVLVLDNASPHTCHQLRERAIQWAKRGLVLYHLPPYSPELNAIEHLWNKLKHKMLPRTAWESIERLGTSLLESLKLLGSVRQLEPMPAL